MLKMLFISSVYKIFDILHIVYGKIYLNNWTHVKVRINN